VNSNINQLVFESELLEESISKKLIGLGLIYAVYRLLKNGNIDTTELDPKAKEVAKQIGQNILKLFNKADEKAGPITDKILSQVVSFSKTVGKEISK